MKIAVYGSAAGDIPTGALSAAHAMGSLIARNGHTLITGACPGVPLEAVRGAAEHGGTIIGYSPSRSASEHARMGLPIEGFTGIEYLPDSFPNGDVHAVRRKARNIASVFACEAAVFIAGRYGTLNEFTLAYDFGKPIGILQGTGGIADVLEGLLDDVFKDPQPPIIFSEDPLEILEFLEGVVSGKQEK